jgi:TerC family integral membrane protein
VAELLPTAVFIVAVLVMLGVDLGVASRRHHELSLQAAALWSGFWVAISVAFGVGLLFWRGSEDSLQFFAGYVLEKSLSLDNLFIFAVIFSSLGVAAKYQHKVLYWGILGALITRGIFIFAGVELVTHISWVLEALGVFVAYSGIKLVASKRARRPLSEDRVFRFIRKLLPVTEKYADGDFTVRQGGRLLATPLLLALVVVEVSDILFAVDSIPAVFAITDDPFIIYTSNICAILGLRSLYFLLAGALTRFRYLNWGLAIILIFVGCKMGLRRLFHLPTAVSLAAILLILAVTIGLSLGRREQAVPPRQPPL